MLKKFRKDSLLQNRIDDILREMDTVVTDTPEYARMTKQLTKLHKLKMAESPKPVNYDTLVLAGANLLGIVTIVKYEQTAVIVSKALNFMHKLR